jgi:hypothetical protein
MRKNWFAVAAVVMIGGALATHAQAGRRSVGALVLTSTGAHGQLATIRASADTEQFLSCQVITEKDAEGVLSSVICSAKDADGRQRACASLQPEMVATARGINGDSYIAFDKDVEGWCSLLLVENASSLRPKEP